MRIPERILRQNNAVESIKTLPDAVVALAEKNKKEFKFKEASSYEIGTSFKK